MCCNCTCGLQGLQCFCLYLFCIWGFLLCRVAACTKFLFFSLCLWFAWRSRAVNPMREPGIFRLPNNLQAVLHFEGNAVNSIMDYLFLLLCLYCTHVSQKLQSKEQKPYNRKIKRTVMSALFEYRRMLWLRSETVGDYTCRALQQQSKRRTMFSRPGIRHITYPNQKLKVVVREQTPDTVWHML